MLHTPKRFTRPASFLSSIVLDIKDPNLAKKRKVELPVVVDLTDEITGMEQGNDSHSLLADKNTPRWILANQQYPNLDNFRIVLISLKPQQYPLAINAYHHIQCCQNTVTKLWRKWIKFKIWQRDPLCSTVWKLWLFFNGGPCGSFPNSTTQRHCEGNARGIVLDSSCI